MMSFRDPRSVRANRALAWLATLVLLFAACVPTTPPGDTPPDVAATVRAELTRSAPPTPEPDLQATISAELTRLAPPTVEPPTIAPPTVEDPPTATPSPTPTPEPPTATPSPTPVTPVVTIPYGIVTASRGINVRSGPDTEYPLLRVIADGTRLEVLGRSLNNEWWQVRVPDLPGGVGWVTAIYLQTYNTGGVPVAAAPPLPPTATPSPTPVPPIVNPPSNPPARPALNPSGSANYGAYSLSAGFVPDPWSVSVISGGSVDVYGALGGNCSGYATTDPDVVLNWSGSGGLLRIYFEADSAGDDATLIIRLPNGSWSCDDDDTSVNSLNPLIHFDSAPSGRYAIWIGSYSPGDYISGQLKATEFASGGPAN